MIFRADVEAMRALDVKEGVGFGVRATASPGSWTTMATCTT